jgi:uncharacterized protein (DUF433 family)
VTRLISDPAIMEGTLCIEGTRIPAKAVIEFHREGYTAKMIRCEYPTLSVDQINDVIDRWPLLPKDMQ